MIPLRMAFQAFINTFKRPATVKYPFAPRTFFERTRGPLEIDFPTCIFCGACQRRCPTDAIVVDRGAKEWKLERLRCISCGSCVAACPVKCLRLDNGKNAVYTSDEKSQATETHRGA